MIIYAITTALLAGTASTTRQEINKELLLAVLTTILILCTFIQSHFIITQQHPLFNIIFLDRLSNREIYNQLNF